MLNFAPLNSVPLADASNAEVSDVFGAPASLQWTAAAATLNRIVGVSGVAATLPWTALADAERIKLVSGVAALAQFTGQVTMQAQVGLIGEPVTIQWTSFHGGFFTVELGGEATIQWGGLLIPADELLQGSAAIMWTGVNDACDRRKRCTGSAASSWSGSLDPPDITTLLGGNGPMAFTSIGEMSFWDDSLGIQFECVSGRADLKLSLAPVSMDVDSQMFSSAAMAFASSGFARRHRRCVNSNEVMTLAAAPAQMDVDKLAFMGSQTLAFAATGTMRNNAKLSGAAAIAFSASLIPDNVIKLQSAAAMTFAASGGPLLRRRLLRPPPAGIVFAQASNMNVAERLGAAGTVKWKAAKAQVAIADKLAGSAALAFSAPPVRAQTIAPLSGSANILHLTTTTTLASNLFTKAPLSRRIYSVPRSRTIFSEPRARTIFYSAADDRDIQVETFEMQPGEVDDYTWIGTEFFKDIPQDQIAAGGVALKGITPSGELALHANGIVLIGSPRHDFSVWLDADLAVDGTKYKVELTMLTEDGREKEIEFYVRIKDA